MDGITIRKNGKAEFAYVAGIQPWHGLGNELKPGSSKEEWREAAGYDWFIRKSRTRFVDDQNITHIYDGYLTLFRSDNKHPLSIVSTKYKIVQPSHVLDFFDDLARTNDFQLHTAGTLFGGKRFWALAKVGENATIVGNDHVGGYLLLATACDGSLKTTADFTTICVVCNNTLNMALSASKRAASRVEISHRSKFDPAEFKAKLGLATGEFTKFITAARDLSNAKISDRSAAKFIAKMLVDAGVVNDEKKDVVESKQFGKIMELFQGKGMGSTMPGRAHTAWGAVNAVTEFVDYHARAKTDSHRMNNAWFGSGDSLKTFALEEALKTFA